MPVDRMTSMLPTLASAGFGARRHGTLRVAICDTDFLMNQTEAATNAVRSLLVGFSGINLRAYAAQHVFDELYGDDGHGHATKFHKLSEQVAESGSPVAPRSFQDAFEERFLPKLTFVHMGDLFADHSLVNRVRRARNGRGASDVPTAQLAVLLSHLRPVTYSHDEHLYKPGVAPRPRHLPAVRGAEDRVARGEHLQIGAAGAVVGAVAGIDALARAGGRWLGVPTWLSRAVTAGLGIWALWSPDRRAAFGNRVGPVVEALLVELEKAHHALELLDGAAADVEPVQAIECRIAEVLVREAHTGGMLAKEIQSGLTTCDPTFGAIPTINELRSVLASSPCFEESPRWRYNLGHQYVRP